MASLSVKASPQGGGPSGPLGTVPEVLCIFSNGHLLSTSVGQPSVLLAAIMFWETLGNPDQQLRRGLLMIGIEIFVRCSVSLGIVSLGGNFYLNMYVYLYINIYVHLFYPPPCFCFFPCP